ncbi:MAG: YheC/YheD family protein [Candidatus Berkiella sp.]
MSKHTFYFFNYVPAIRYHISRCLKERGWVEAKNAASADFGDRHLSLHDEASKNLEYKHLLAKLVEKIDPPVMPLTYTLNDDNAGQVLARVIYEKYLVNNQYQATIPGLQWILKPSMLNNGDEIKLFNNIEEVKKHYASTKRLGGEHVLQQFISDPALIDGRKYTYRLHVVATNYAGVFMYDQGYINISALPYSKENNFASRKMVITNYVLDGVLANIEQRSTTLLPDFAETYEQMKAIITQVMKALLAKQPDYLKPQATPIFEIFGFDFTKDSSGKLWLLEINQGPDMPTFEDNPLKAGLWLRFWQDIVDEFVIPCALGVAPKSEYAHFTQVLTRGESYSAYRNFLYKLFHSPRKTV